MIFLEDESLSSIHRNENHILKNLRVSSRHLEVTDVGDGYRWLLIYLLFPKEFSILFCVDDFHISIRKYVINNRTCLLSSAWSMSVSVNHNTS